MRRTLARKGLVREFAASRSLPEAIWYQMSFATCPTNKEDGIKLPRITLGTVRIQCDLCPYTYGWRVEDEGFPDLCMNDVGFACDIVAFNVCEFAIRNVLICLQLFTLL